MAHAAKLHWKEGKNLLGCLSAHLGQYFLSSSNPLAPGLQGHIAEGGGIKDIALADPKTSGLMEAEAVTLTGTWAQEMGVGGAPAVQAAAVRARKGRKGSVGASGQVAVLA